MSIYKLVDRVRVIQITTWVKEMVLKEGDRYYNNRYTVEFGLWTFRRTEEGEGTDKE